MRLNARNFLPWFGLGCVFFALIWAFSLGTLPPADFTFWNETEIASVDPQIITGVPEARISMALFEGLARWDPKTLAPLPGVAERWEISEDRKQYTFHLRKNAKWSDGSSVTAHDFHWAWRRLLDPKTASQYVYQLSFYVKNGRKYNSAEVAVGDAVEVELLKGHDALPGARGEVLYGRLLEIEKAPPPGDGEPNGNAEQRVFKVEIDGHPRSFTAQSSLANSQITLCDSVLPDYRSVGVKVIDDYTLEVTLENPTPFFNSLTAFHTLSPVQRKCVEKYGYPEWTKPEHLVSNGAFTLQERRLRDRIRLRKNPHYWNAENVHLESVDALSVNSDVTALNMYMTRQADWIVNVPASAAPILRAQQRPDLLLSQELSTAFYRLNTTKPPLNNPKLRKALALAVDRRKVIDTVLRMDEIPAYTLVPPFLDTYQPQRCASEDVAAARRLLDEAGFGDRDQIRKLTILCNDQVDNLIVAELLQFQWQQNLGITCGLEKLEWNAYLSAQREKKYDLARAGWTSDYLDPASFLGMFITDGEDNMTGWSNARYDELIALAAQEPDQERRMTYFQQAERILMDELPIIPFYYRKTKGMARPYVRGIHENLLDLHPLWNISVDQAAKRRFLAGEGTP